MIEACHLPGCRVYNGSTSHTCNHGFMNKAPTVRSGLDDNGHDTRRRFAQ
jgi:hypothetical protein